MFRAIVLSAFILGTAASVNYGYEILLKQVDNLIASTYGSLAQSENPELQQAGSEVTSSYFSYRQNQ